MSYKEIEKLLENYGKSRKEKKLIKALLFAIQEMSVTNAFAKQRIKEVSEILHDDV